jgi:hypothetical protein
MFATRFTLGAAGLACLLATAATSYAANATGTLTFNSFSTGQKIDTEYVNEYGITISARNASGGPNVATLYNSGATTGTDANLMAPFDRGNLAGKSLSKLLVIAANDTDANGDGKIDKPDDAGAGSLIFDFTQPVMCFGFDLVNINGITSTSGSKGYSVEFFNGSSKVGQVGFDQFITKGGTFYDASIQYGVNSANRVQPILATKFGGTQYTRAILNLGGPGAVDNVNWKDIVVPEPTGIALLALGVPALLARRRART